VSTKNNSPLTPHNKASQKLQKPPYFERDVICERRFMKIANLFFVNN